MEIQSCHRLPLNLLERSLMPQTAERKAAYAKERYAARGASLRAKQAEWRAANREHLKARSMKRRAATRKRSPAIPTRAPRAGRICGGRRRLRRCGDAMTREKYHGKIGPADAMDATDPAFLTAYSEAAASLMRAVTDFELATGRVVDSISLETLDVTTLHDVAPRSVRTARLHFLPKPVEVSW
jgi:hypothetical protein